jgi:hypothetical protein
MLANQVISVLGVAEFDPVAYVILVPSLQRSILSGFGVVSR